MPIAQAQQASPSPTDPGTIKVETRVVLVDTVVTDKKGNYIRDLATNNFKIWEDGKEQPVTSFSREDSAADPSHSGKHYLVLFFDNSTMEFADQAKARDAAAKFVDSNTGPDRLIAVVEFGGMVRITQNFTSDADRLKKVVAGVKFSHVSPNADVASLGAPPSQPALLGMPSMGGLESDFGVRSVFLALRNLAKGLSGVSGRKSLVMLSAGFPMNFEVQSELTAVIDACNKANVAVYPIDVRGLVAPIPTVSNSFHHPRIGTSSARLRPASFNFGNSSSHARLLLTSMEAEEPLPPQHGGGGGAGAVGGRVAAEDTVAERVVVVEQEAVVGTAAVEQAGLVVVEDTVEAGHRRRLHGRPWGWGDRRNQQSPL